MKYVLVFIFCSLFISCDKKLGPVEVLRSYINYRFEQNQSKSVILSYLSGEIKERIEQMGPEDFQNFSQEKNRKRGKFKVILKKCTELKCSITYLLKYKEGAKEGVYGVEVKKIASLENIEGQWKISDVSSIKTHISTDKAIELKQ